MANEQSGVKFFVIYTIVALMTGSQVRAEDNPMAMVIQQMLMESMRGQGGASVLGNVLQGLLQPDGKAGGAGGAAGAGGAEMLAGLGSILQAAMAAKGDGAKDSGGLDPAMLGNVMSLLSTLGKAPSDTDNNNVDENNNDHGSNQGAVDIGQAKKTEGAIDWESLVGSVGNLVSMFQGEGVDGGVKSLLNLVAVMMNSATGQHNMHSKDIPHHNHDSFLPPILENLHEYWDYFSNTEFGKALRQTSGLNDLAQHFTNEKGHWQMDKVFESLEKNSFRRKWISSGARFLAQWLKHLLDPEIQSRYKDTLQMLCNSFLKSQGYPKSALLDFNRPVDSISNAADTLFQTQFQLGVNSRPYVEAVISYLKSLVHLGANKVKSSGVGKLSTEELEGRLAETIDRDLIEPIVKVNRAYKYAVKRKQCAKYVICAVNDNMDNEKGLKPGITKLTSLAASWFLSEQAGVSFWDLYSAATEGGKCTKYEKKCEDYHTEDLKATTEYFHNEL